MKRPLLLSLRRLPWLPPAALVALTLLAGCLGGRFGVTDAPPDGAPAELATEVAPAAPVAPDPLPVPPPAQETEPTPASTSSEPVIRPGDRILIEVYREADLSGSFALSADGYIRHAILGRVTLGGLTVSAAEKRLADILGKDYLVNPRVLVTLESSASRRVVILGEVKSPGVYNFAPGQEFTLLQGIGMAGGFTDVAAIDRVRIVRTADGLEETLKVKVSQLLRGDGDGDVPLAPNDVITVPETIF